MFALILCSLFSDHSVLQRGHENPIWGQDIPAQVVTLTVEGTPAQQFAPVKVVTDNKGNWKLFCPELPVGGPYRLHLAGSTERVVDDVMVGDVWIASGQSNMEFPLSRALNAGQEISQAKYAQIRFAKITRTTATEPAASVSTSWETCEPQSAGHFSAVAYFFAREVFERTRVPIGIIDSTWGGTPVEAWTSREGLRPVMPGIDNVLERIAANGPEIRKIRAEYEAKNLAWQRQAFPQDTENKGEAAGWAKPGWDDHGWRSIQAPNTVQSQGLKANGVFWFRRNVELPAAWAGQDLELNLGAVDDFDTTYFNGEQVGATGPETPNAYQLARHYRVPSRLVHPGANTIAIRVFDHFGDGGLLGPAAELSVHPLGNRAEALALAGAWLWTIETQFPLVPASVYATSPAVPPELAGESSPATLYNGMIAPLIPYGIRGFIWYQGEANVQNASVYRDRFTALIRDWRGRWGQGTLPFYFVQLAGFRETPGWPYLREAQSATRAEAATGLAVALDVGNPDDIHPTNKQAVGHRLALLALANSYRINGVVDRGPQMNAVTIEGRRVRIHWANAEGLHTRDGKPATGFAVAGKDGVYHAAEATIEAADVTIYSAEVPEPKNVRYGWADTIEVNLENHASLPAEPFRTDNEPLSTVH